MKRALRRRYGLGNSKRSRKRSPVKLKCEPVFLPGELPRHHPDRKLKMCRWTQVAPFRAARFVERGAPEFQAIVHPSTKVKGKCQLTWFDREGPSGDQQHPTCQSALKELHHKIWKLAEWG